MWCLAFLILLLGPSEGFKPLFNGKDLTGWSFVFRKPVDAKKTFLIKDGTIVCTGKPVGYMTTDKAFKEFTLRFDWRYKRPKNLEDDAEFLGNSGYLLFIQKDWVWPVSVEVQGMNRDVGGIIPIKTKAEFTTDKEARKKARKPVGEWNSMEIVVKNGTITVFLNGAKISTVTKYTPKTGRIGFQSEGAEIHWKNIRIRKEPWEPKKPKKPKKEPKK